MRIYTRGGDDGTTGLIGGQRVSKAEARVACTGVVDELNAALGFGAVAAGDHIGRMLRQAQADLFVIGSHLAAPQEAAGQLLPPLDASMSERLEGQIDAAEAQLEPLRQFILPGGSEAAARLHLARTVCRRAERSVVELAAGHQVSPAILVYLNRLSDWLFVHARLANHQAGVADIPWVPSRRRNNADNP
jgi:cob(I)alamin adenosyltransferase